MTAITIPDRFKVTPEQFDELAAINRDIRMELTAKGELIAMPPTGGTAGRRNYWLRKRLDFYLQNQNPAEIVILSDRTFDADQLTIEYANLQVFPGEVHYAEWET